MSTRTAGGPPAAIRISPDGPMTGRSRRYEKFLRDLAGVYQDEAAFEYEVSVGGDRLVYQVDEQRYGDGEGALIVGTSTLQAGQVGDEFAVTRGHIHAIVNRAELYHCLSGRGVMLLETIDGRSEAIELTPGVATNVPGGWIHRSVNVGDEPFVTLFCYAEDAGQDYGIIGDAGGMRQLIVRADNEQGWASVPNPSHVGYLQAVNA